MEEKMTEQPIRPGEETGAESLRIDWRSELGDAYGNANAVFRKWLSEGLVPADMYRRVSDLFDLDPAAAEEMFGADFMDTVDYFTHYWG